MRVILRSSMRSIVMMRCFTIHSRVNAFAVTELVLSYDGVPSYTVSIMEFSDGRVARETQYFGDPFKPGPSRAHLVEPND